MSQGGVKGYGDNDNPIFFRSGTEPGGNGIGGFTLRTTIAGIVGDGKFSNGAVSGAFIQQKERGQQRLNGKLNEEEIEQYCKLSQEARTILESAIEKFALSHRSIASVKKVARTIADIEGHEMIQKRDMLGALSYRRR